MMSNTLTMFSAAPFYLSHFNSKTCIEDKFRKIQGRVLQSGNRFPPLAAFPGWKDHRIRIQPTGRKNGIRAYGNGADGEQRIDVRRFLGGPDADNRVFAGF